MRDIGITSRKSDGTATFSIKNIAPINGMEILANKVTKAILQQTRETPLQAYTGVDAHGLAKRSGDNATLTETRLELTSILKIITDQIIKDTPSSADSIEQLNSLSLEDFYYSQSNHQFYLKIKIYPMRGQSKLLTFPVDDRKW